MKTTGNNWARLAFILAPLAVAFGGSFPLEVPQSPDGEVRLTGYVDTVGSDELTYLLGQSFEIVIGYHLTGWDGVRTSFIETTGGTTCHPGVLACITYYSDPMGGFNLLSFGVSNGQLVQVVDVRGCCGVWWDTSVSRWQGNWSPGDVPGNSNWSISGPVTSGGIFATPEPASATIVLAGILTMLPIAARRKRSATGAAMAKL